MVRLPCCDKVGVKKGQWTPEEDIVLVSYVQQYGSKNWSSIPIRTGLLRCGKSCRLRWMNYLRPGVKRGNFTNQEDNLIIHLQALLGNRWAAIASYLPERTVNDIKNYWNVHLRKKVRKVFQEEERGQWERRLQEDVKKARQALHDALSVDKSSYQNSSSSNYALSTENISRLLEGWTEKKESTLEYCYQGTTTRMVDRFMSSVGVSGSPAEAEGLLLLEEETLDSWLIDESGGVYN